MKVTGSRLLNNNSLLYSIKQFETAVVVEGREGEEEVQSVTSNDLVTSTTEPVMSNTVISNENALVVSIPPTTTLTPFLVKENEPLSEKEQSLVFSLLANLTEERNIASSPVASMANNSKSATTIATTKEVSLVNGIEDDMTSALAKAPSPTPIFKSFITSSGSTLEGRHLADKPLLTAFTNELDPINGINNGTTSNANTKLENVANFLSNFFNVLGLTGKTVPGGIDYQGTAVDGPSPAVATPSGAQLPPVPNSVMLVEDDSQLVPSLVFSSSGDQVEIITAQPPAQAYNKHFEVPFRQFNKPNELVVGASMQSGQINLLSQGAHRGHVETMKSVRDLPHSSSNLSKNVPLERHLQGSNSGPKFASGPQFSNGWRAIPIMKHKQRPQIDRPIYVENKRIEESSSSKTEPSSLPSPTTVQMTTTTTSTTTTSTTAKPDAVTTDASNNHNLGTTHQSTDINKGKILKGYLKTDPF